MKNPKGVVYKRKQRIMQQLKEKGSVSVEDLAQALEVSPVTIRRDLQEFEEQGLVDRFYGGANLVAGALLEKAQEMPSLQIRCRQAIAKRAAAMIEDGDVVFFNSSGTVLSILYYLKGKRATIITNNALALDIPRDPLVDLVLVGGEAMENTRSLVGDFALSSISRVNADKAFIGVSGISARGGVTSSTLQETTINEAMFSHCIGKRFVCADYTKVGSEYNYRACQVDMVTHLITDTHCGIQALDELRSSGLEILTTPPLDWIESDRRVK